MACIAHVGTRNVSVDRPTPSELGDTTTSIQEKNRRRQESRPPPQMSLRMVEAHLMRICEALKRVVEPTNFVAAMQGFCRVNT